METVYIFALALLAEFAWMIVLLLILRDVKAFLQTTMVYMKAKDIHDVLAADSLLRETKPPEDENEVVNGVAHDAMVNMMKLQRANREKHGVTEA